MSQLVPSKYLRHISWSIPAGCWKVYMTNGDYLETKAFRLTFVEDGQKSGPFLYFSESEGVPSVSYPRGDKRATETELFLLDHGLPGIDSDNFVDALNDWLRQDSSD